VLLGTLWELEGKKLGSSSQILPFLTVQLQMTFFCNILQHYQLLFVDFTWRVSASLCHEYIFIQIVSSVWHLLCDDHLSSVLKRGLQSKVQAKQLFMLTRKPSPAAS
jgi:hypothetical protein